MKWVKDIAAGFLGVKWSGIHNLVVVDIIIKLHLLLPSPQRYYQLKIPTVV